MCTLYSITVTASLRNKLTVPKTIVPFICSLFPLSFYLNHHSTSWFLSFISNFEIINIRINNIKIINIKIINILQYVSYEQKFKGLPKLNISAAYNTTSVSTIPGITWFEYPIGTHPTLCHAIDGSAIVYLYIHSIYYHYVAIINGIIL